jgi:hypothetical protein
MSTLINTQTVRGTTEQRALTLLGSGLGAEVVASAAGVSISRISQLLSEPDFAAAVAELRFKSLSKHNERDNEYDEIESSLVARLKDLMPLMHRPMEVLKAIQVINAAKRRGQSAPDTLTNQSNVVNLVMPTMIVQKFTTNINNQVIQAGAQTLETMQSHKLLESSASKKGKTNEISLHSLDEAI